MEGRRRPIGYIVFGLIAVVLVGWLVTRYAVKRQLLRGLGSNDMKVRVASAEKLLEMEKLSDSLPAQPIIARSKTAQALGEIGTDDAIAVLGEILADQEEAPRRWARQALVKQGMKSMPVLLSALSASGGTRDEAITALKQIGQKTTPEIRFFLADGAASAGAASALATVGGKVAVDALIQGCYNDDTGLRDKSLNNLGLRRIKAGLEPALYNLKPLPKSEKGNALKALGLIGEKQAVPAMIPFLKDADLREAAVTSLGQIADARAVEPIVSTLLVTDKRYRNAAILALRRIGLPAFPALVRELKSTQVLMRRGAADALVGSDSASVNSPLMASLSDPDSEVRSSAALALGWGGNTAAVPALVTALSDQSWEVVDSAVSALGEIGPAAAPALLNVVASPATDLTVQYQVSRALADMGREIVPRLEAALHEPSPAVQTWSAIALGSIGDSSATDALKALAERGNPEVRWVAEEQLKKIASTGI
jgi:HEAT repeat protein